MVAVVVVVVVVGQVETAEAMSGEKFGKEWFPQLEKQALEMALDCSCEERQSSGQEHKRKPFYRPDFAQGLRLASSPHHRSCPRCFA